MYQKLYTHSTNLSTLHNNLVPLCDIFSVQHNLKISHKLVSRVMVLHCAGLHNISGIQGTSVSDGLSLCRISKNIWQPRYS